MYGPDEGQTGVGGRLYSNRLPPRLPYSERGNLDPGPSTTVTVNPPDTSSPLEHTDGPIITSHYRRDYPLLVAIICESLIPITPLTSGPTPSLTLYVGLLKAPYVPRPRTGTIQRTVGSVPRSPSRRTPLVERQGPILGSRENGGPLDLTRSKLRTNILPRNPPSSRSKPLTPS